MSISISPNGRTLIDLTFDSTYGSCGLVGYFLNFQIKLDIPRYTGEFIEKVYIRNIYLIIKIANKVIGRAIPEDQITYTPYADLNQSKFQNFQLSLSREEIEKIEAIRLGNDIELQVDIKGEWGDQYNFSMSFSQPTIFKINQKQWIDILGQMKHSSHLLFEISVDPSQSDDNSLVFHNLENAKKQMLYGHYDEVVIYCRKIMEIVLKDKKLTELKKAYAERDKSQKMSKSDRFDNLYGAIIHAMHPSAHLQTDEFALNNYSFSRDEAKLLLTTTIAAFSVFQPIEKN